MAHDLTIIGQLAEQPQQDNHEAIASWLRIMAVDLLANGRRRIKQQQFEDALLRAYRVLELIGQFRLFDLGYDSACINPQDQKVEALRKELKHKKRADFGTGKNGFLIASRLLVARLLRKLGDSVGEKLLKFDNELPHKDNENPQKNRTAKAGFRNRSILIHGFTSASTDEQSLCNLYKRLDDLLDEGRTEVSGNLPAVSAAHFGEIPEP